MDRRPGSEDLEAERHQDRIDADQDARQEAEQPSRLSTCGRCGGTIRWSGDWDHTVLNGRTTGHFPEPDDSAVSGPAEDDL